MSFEAIDVILLPWLDRHGLHLMREYKETEVRSTMIVDDSGEVYSIWVDKPDLQSRVRVTAGLIDTVHGRVSPRVREGCSIERVSTVPDLAMVLEQVYGQVVEWIRQAGHTRSPS